MARDTEHRLEETSATYCKSVYTSIALGPLGQDDDSVSVCRTLAGNILPMLTLPPLTVFNAQKGINEETLASVLLAARRLNHTLTRLAAVGTEALLRPLRRGVMAAASKTPERQLYCDMHARVLPRLRNLIHLLQTRMPQPQHSFPLASDRRLDSIRSHSALRLYALTLLEYAQEQMSLISVLFLPWLND
ncbi:hypothetical protein NP493_850g01055 [Ridgeia piscesae]|uniref:Uncharacterized protein n=1 Tax=Ridgeia piscesae TaxID=27915 RepID=A0AAD9KLX0_RIDPI|nr:hypothetical protein NP493_850g01055 [Ridgeia piscesae]